MSYILSGKKPHRTTVYLSTLMFSFYFCEASVGTWKVMHVLKGTHICCALGAGRQHCYWGPNLIFSLFWSSTFNHWLLGGSAFPKKLFESRKKMLLQHVYGIIHVKRGLAQKNAAYVRLYREKNGQLSSGRCGWKPRHNCEQSGHSKLAISISTKAASPRWFEMISAVQGRQQ